MIIIKLSGGLGNQMFQYAIARILARSSSSDVLLDNSFFQLKKKFPGHTPRNFELSIFNNEYREASKSDIYYFIHLSFLNRIKRKLWLPHPKIYREPSIEFQKDLLSIRSSIYLRGYFQSFKYFRGNEELIKEIFAFPIDDIGERNENILQQIKKNISIGVHIRRGDYISDETTRESHGYCNMDYYLKAINFIASKIDKFTLVFFSDDNVWVKSVFDSVPFPKIFVDHNDGNESWKDMFLMSECNHNIIANSTFSWWSAWLNPNSEKIVVAPRKWFAKENFPNDIIPTEWKTF